MAKIVMFVLGKLPIGNKAGNALFKLNLKPYFYYNLKEGDSCWIMDLKDMAITDEFKVLMLEDSPNDAELIMYEAKKNFNAEFTLTDEYDKFLSLLKEGDFDIILADYHLRNFNGVDALIATRKFNMKIPFIFVSGAMGEEQAVNALKYGATDYVLKNNLKKLPFAIGRAITELKENRKLLEAERKKEVLLEELIQKNRALSCLFKISELMGDKERDLLTKLSSATHVMKEGFVYPEDITIRIVFDEWEWTSGPIPAKKIKIAERFIKEGSEVEIEIFYDCSDQERKFIDQEIELVKSVKGQIMNMFDHSKAEEKLIATMLESEEKERKRIARDIHDSLQQTLVIANLNLNVVSKNIESMENGLEAKYLEKLAIAREYLGRSMEESRSIAHELAPHRESDLPEMIDALIRTLSKSSDIEFILKNNMEDELIDSSLRLNIFRITQEAFNNIMKHANATRVRINISSGFGKLILSVEDNGNGFDPAKLKQAKSDFGFQNMIHRAKSMGGTFTLNSKEGVGTFVQLNIPLNQPHNDLNIAE